MLRYIISFVRALNSNSKPSEIAHAFGIGLMLGFMPKDNLLWYLLLVFFMFCRINKGGYFIMMLAGALAAPAADPLFDKVGYFILSWAPLEPVFARLLDVPFVAFTRFNNTVVCGALVCGIICYVPLYFLMRLFVGAWRNKIAPRFNESRFGKFFYKLPLVNKIVKAAVELG
ncbi:MAG TPA: TIGR03546 family protein [Treponema sp.]|nr:TIGR03546 family protein [Treponema sp.]